MASSDAKNEDPDDVIWTPGFPAIPTAVLEVIYALPCATKRSMNPVDNWVIGGQINAISPVWML